MMMDVMQIVLLKQATNAILEQKVRRMNVSQCVVMEDRWVLKNVMMVTLLMVMVVIKHAR